MSLSQRRQYKPMTFHPGVFMEALEALGNERGMGSHDILVNGTEKFEGGFRRKIDERSLKAVATIKGLGGGPLGFDDLGITWRPKRDVAPNLRIVINNWSRYFSLTVSADTAND